MNRSVKKKPTAGQSLYQQLSIFDSIGFDALTKEVVSQLTQPTALAASGLLDAIPPLHSYFRINHNTVLTPFGEKAKLIANVTAIRLAKQLLREDRPATDDEKKLLVQFSGWGELANVWNLEAFAEYGEATAQLSPMSAEVERWGKRYYKARLELGELLSDEEIERASQSTLNAYYTSHTVIKAIWQAVVSMGFTGGRIVEPAAGSGHFIGAMPDNLRQQSRVTAIEKDTLTAQILGLLYPELETHVSGFEDVQIQPESIDLVIGNVPFGNYKVYDRHNRDLSDLPIHNYFIGRSARLIREGGLLALITSAGTLDSGSRKFRQNLHREGMELVGAIRLPSCAFEQNAGTEVTTDILFMQKCVASVRRFSQFSYVGTTTVRTIAPVDEETEVAKSIIINEYFAERPAMMLGEMFLAEEVGKGGLYRGDSQTLFLANPNELTTRLDGALTLLPTAIFKPLNRNPFGELGRMAVNGYAGRVNIKGRSFTQSLIIREYETLKAAFSALLRAELNAEADVVTDPLRQALNNEYYRFTGCFGRLNKNRSIAFLEGYDPKFLMVQALELIEKGKDGKDVISKSAILTERVYPLRPLSVVETAEDALRVSLYECGRIDSAFIAAKLTKTVSEVEHELITKRLVFRHPATDKLIDRDTYLSGDIREKIVQARLWLDQKLALQANILALEAVMPPTVPLSLITFQLGSVWLPAELIKEWIKHELELDIRLRYNDQSCAYDLTVNNPYAVKNRSMGTAERKASDLIESALNGRSVVVTKTILDAEGNKREVKDIEATSQAVQAQEILQELFIDYCRTNYVERIEKAFNDRFNGHVFKTYHRPQVAHYPGASPFIFLRNHQFKGVERIKDEDTMLAHEVGTGKTFTMISAAMEMIRLGRLSKVIIAVQNSTVRDFARAWRTLYPSALIYVPEKSDLETTNRKRFLQRIATNKFDGIVLPQSFLKLIPSDPTAEEELISEEIARIEAQGSSSREDQRASKKRIKALNKLKLSVEVRRKAQADRKQDDILHFAQLGVDGLFLDEAHKYKRYGFHTHRRNIKGIDSEGSQDAFQAMAKCRTIQRKGGRVVLATGTPISNTMAEAWTMLRYLAIERLESLQLTTFDQFAGTFGQIIPSFELTPGGQFKAIERFAKFVNVQQLSDLYRSHVDVVLNEDVIEFKEDATLPVLKEQTPTQEDGSQRIEPGYTRILLPQTEGIAAELNVVRQTLSWYEKLSGKQKKENAHVPLVMFGQAKKATLDIRLLSVSNPDEDGSKINRAVAELFSRYVQTESYKGTQLVFSDLYQSPATTDEFWDDEQRYPNPDFGKPRFNLFEDIKAKLIALGVEANQIAIVPADANKREPIFQNVRTGDVRILLGSSERMGIGVNVQERLYAVHHLDAPARPTDFGQRNGRILRQGNLHALWKIPVEILTYGVERTLDATAYGRLAIKQKFINQVLKGTNLTDSISDVSSDDDFSSMSFDQMMATLSGSQYALMYTAQNHELTRLKQQKKNWQRTLIDAQGMIERNRNVVNKLLAQLPQLDMEAEIIGGKFPNGFTIDSVEFAGKMYSEKWGHDLEDYFLRLRHLAKRGAEARGTLKINGLTIGLQGLLIVDDFTEPSYGIEYSWGLSLMVAIKHASGLIPSLRANLERITDAPVSARQSIAYSQQVIDEYSPRLTQTFKRQAELDALEESVQQLQQLLEAESNASNLQTEALPVAA